MSKFFQFGDKLRVFRSYLSINFFHHNTNDLETKKILSFINIQISKKNSKKKLKTKTHVTLVNKIIQIINDNKLSNFLRVSYLQKIFFIHNRFFLFYYLYRLYVDKNWKKWKRLIKENKVGNPLSFFFLKSTSGNKIFQTFHLMNFSNFSELPLEKFNFILEFGGGYGNMALTFKKLNKESKYIIFDLFEVNLLQYYYLKKNKVNCSFDINSNSKIILVSDLKKLQILLNKNKKVVNNLLIGNWSISETPILLRKRMKKIFNFFENIFVCFQDKFEKIDNLKYFENDFFHNIEDKKKAIFLNIPMLKTSKYLFKQKLN